MQKQNQKPIPEIIMQNIIDAKRIVVKIGTNSLMEKTNSDDTVVNQDLNDTSHDKKIPLKKSINTQLLDMIVNQLIYLATQGKEIILVSSGSIGLGAEELAEALPIAEIPLRQACAAVGQPLLMQEYKRVFQRYNSHCAQLLLTGNDFNSKTSYIALKNCIELLLKKKVVPIINENDSVSIDEIGVTFGDNDSLSAMVATHTASQVLVLLTDVDGVYDKNPHNNSDAQKLMFIDDIDECMRNFEKKNSHENFGSSFGTGGMKTKLVAAKITHKAQCTTIIARSNQPDVLKNIFSGNITGTVIV